ncbi:ring-opening amidohydrolase [Radiobacillus sp. PE A8.2]|uniref:cyanuric acid amidohydrolase n=1 Tax=Radiobacillus sp. PE A8.2 TaxID=3380349 RepID=UPI00388D3F18
MKCSVVRVPHAAPDDVRELKAQIEAGVIDPTKVIAVMGKTEGNGCVNDFTRGFATRSLDSFFANYSPASPISYVMSGGTEGILSPHFTVVSRDDDETSGTANLEKALAIGVAKTPAFLPEQIGRMEQVHAVAKAVEAAMQEAKIESKSDVHFVQVKCPLLTSDLIYRARSEGHALVTEDTYKSMGYSRGASALGVAVALEETSRENLDESDICHSWEKFSGVASTSAGSELDYCEVIVFGNSKSAVGPLFIDHVVMQDAIDGVVVKSMIDKYPNASIIQVLAKAEADPTGFVRERRHTMLNDSDINHTRHARAVVGGVLASISGDPMIYVSGGAEHQGPSGGGPVAVIFQQNK